jgi:hypothetical protein
MRYQGQVEHKYRISNVKNEVRNGTPRRRDKYGFANLLVTIRPWEEGAGQEGACSWRFKKPVAGRILRLERGVGMVFIGKYVFLKWDLGQKLCKFSKKIIVTSKFDDYHLWFGYKD